MNEPKPGSQLNNAIKSQGSSFLLKVLPQGQEFELLEGESVRQALYRNGIEVEGPCNGQGICGQCGVWVESPEEVPETPHENISSVQESKGLRLSCQLKPQYDLSIRLPESCQYPEKALSRDGYLLQGKRRKRTRIASAVRVFSHRQGRWWIQYDRVNEVKKLDIWSEKFNPKGVAIDIGTTTLMVTLLSLQTGQELATASKLNPQIQFGHDVMTRIQYGSTPEGLTDLCQTLRKGINQLLQQTCEDSGSDLNEILDVAIGGNTTMLELLACIDPSPLGKIPFKVDLQGGRSFPVHDFGLEINPQARVYIAPVLHAFIGTDISSGLLMHDEFFDDSCSVLYIDVGTNGELGLNIKGKRLITSAAAGPAFEGMGISCGKRASIGAIEAVRTDGYDLDLYTIGQAEVKGICGSGIVDLLACLLRLGILDTSGRLNSSRDLKIAPSVISRLEEIDGQWAFRLGEGIYFTQKDIRQVQLAKGAIRAAIDILLQETGSLATELDKIVIAGGFGFSLLPDSLEAIGLIPPGTKDKVSFAGNASLNGCSSLLTDITFRRFIENESEKMIHIPIAEKPEFMDQYVESMNFPSQGEVLQQA